MISNCVSIVWMSFSFCHSCGDSDWGWQRGAGHQYLWPCPELPHETSPHLLQQPLLHLPGALQVHHWHGGPGVHRELQVQVCVCHPAGALCHPHLHPPAQHAHCTDGRDCQQDCTGEQEHLETPGMSVLWGCCLKKKVWGTIRDFRENFRSWCVWITGHCFFLIHLNSSYKKILVPFPCKFDVLPRQTFLVFHRCSEYKKGSIFVTGQNYLHFVWWKIPIRLWRERLCKGKTNQNQFLFEVRKGTS